MWKVVPIQGRQLLDVREEDLLVNGLFRKCDTYRGGGGYDKFPAVCKKRLGFDYHNQFVVQLYGCPFKCPYCYVTTDGVLGKYTEVMTDELMFHFKNSHQDIFHLMGGAPALYIENWDDIISKMPHNKVFHSDFLLMEKSYDGHWLHDIAKPNCLYAVSIKGVDDEDFFNNTGVKPNWSLFWYNLQQLVEHKVNFYLTFTNPAEETKMNEFKTKLTDRFGYAILEDSFNIDLVKYKALEISK